MKLYYCRQRSEEWFSLRLGIPTASNFHKILTAGGKPSKQAESYMMRLIAEWYFGGELEDPASEYQSQWMQRGELLESRAADAFEFETGLTTHEVGFVTNDSGTVGCSPDRLVGDDEGLEIKCTSPVVHVTHMVKGYLADDHYPQVQGNMLICERQAWRVMSYCPPFPNIIIRVPRDDEYQEKLTVALAEFNAKMYQLRTLMVNKYGPPLRERAVPTQNESCPLGVSDEDVDAILAAAKEAQ